MEKEAIGTKFLVSTKNWFTAPDGNEYKAVFGTCVDITSDSMIIGKVLIMREQILTVIATKECFEGESEGWTSDAEHGIRRYMKPSLIYFAD